MGPGVAHRAQPDIVAIENHHMESAVDESNTTKRKLGHVVCLIQGRSSHQTLLKLRNTLYTMPSELQPDRKHM